MKRTLAIILLVGCPSPGPDTSTETTTESTESTTEDTGDDEDGGVCVGQDNPCEPDDVPCCDGLDCTLIIATSFFCIDFGDSDGGTETGDET